MKIVSCHTVYSKPVKLEVDNTVILPPLVFPVSAVDWPMPWTSELNSLHFCIHSSIVKPWHCADIWYICSKHIMAAFFCRNIWPSNRPICWRMHLLMIVIVKEKTCFNKASICLLLCHVFDPHLDIALRLLA